MGLCVLHACRSLGGQKWAGPLELESEMQAKPRFSAEQYLLLTAENLSSASSLLTVWCPCAVCHTQVTWMLTRGLISPC